MSEQKTDLPTQAPDEQLSQGEEGQLTWRRAHPLSPLVRSWVLVLAFFFAVIRPAVERIIEGEEDFSLDRVMHIPPPDVSWLQFLQMFGQFWFFALLGLFFIVLLVPFFISWFFYRFAVDEWNIYVKSGLLFKTERKARLDRVQSIDVHRSLLARLLGLAELKFDVADGSSSALNVQFLKYSDARQLRDELLAQVRSLQADGPGSAGGAVAPGAGEPPRAEPRGQASEAGQADETEIIRIPVGRLIGSMALSLGLLSFTLVVLVLAGLMLWSGAGVGAILASNAALLLTLASVVWRRFNTGFKFRLSTSPDGLKTRFGFTDTMTKTVPEGRIQMISVTQPLLWRLTGWYRVEVSLAGQGEGGAFAGELLPVGTRDELLRVLPLVVATGEEGGADAVQLHAGLTAKGDGEGFTATPLGRKWRVDWLAVSRNAFALTPALLLVRRGMIRRKLDIVPHPKVQELAVSQGPLGRYLGLAEVEVSTAAGGETQIDYVDAEVARALFVREAQLALPAGSVGRH